MCRSTKQTPKKTGYRAKHINARPYKKDKYKNYEEYA